MIRYIACGLYLFVGLACWVVALITALAGSYMYEWAFWGLAFMFFSHELREESK